MALRTATVARATAAAATPSAAAAPSLHLETPRHPQRPHNCAGESPAACATASAVWTKALESLSGYSLAEVTVTSSAIQTAFCSGVVVAHNLNALAKEAVAKAAAERSGGVAAAPRAYSHFQMEAVARKYAKPELLEVSKLPVAVDCAAAPAACPAALAAGDGEPAEGCCCAAGLHLVTIGNTGFVPWVTVRSPPPPGLFTPVSSAAASKGAPDGAAPAVPASAETQGAPAADSIVSPPGSQPVSTLRSLSSISGVSQTTLASEASAICPAKHPQRA